MDTLLCNQDGTILFGDATSGVDNLIKFDETLAFLYTGSATQATYTWSAEGVTYADILVVGGGGGTVDNSTSSNPKGGGGGGEVVFRQGVAVTPNTTIKVGRGGPIDTQGGISEFGAIRANGGGKGNAGAGGSGGGAARNVIVGGVSSKLSADGMGNAGGVSIAGIVGAAGGGGAMEPGFTVTAGGQGSNGGQGYTANVFGVWNTVYGSGGGGGARYNTVSLGGTNAGNGGSADAGTPDAQPGVANTGGGAGGAGATGVARPGAVGGSGIVLVKPNPGILDGLGSSVYSTAVGAYAMRRLFGAYTGPQARLRRSTDSAEIDVYFDKYGRPENFDLDGWLAGATGYIVTWYDQGPDVSPKHMTGYASGGATLPVLYKREDGIYVVSFTGTSTTVGNYFNAGTITFNVSTNGGVSTFSSVNFKGANLWERVYDYGSGASSDNLLFARNSTSTTTTLALYNGSASKLLSVTPLYNLDGAWRSYGCRVQGSGSTWEFLQRINGVENTTSITSTAFGDRTLMNTYLGRSNWAADSYSNLYLESQLFFNTGTISSSQFKVMENVMSYQFFGGRYVRLLQPTIGGYIGFRELEVYDTNNVNIALNQPVTGDVPPAAADEGYQELTDGINNVSTNFTRVIGSTQPFYVQVDLGSMRAITKIVLYNRSDDATTRGRAIGIKVQILADDGITIIHEQPAISSANNTYTFNY